MDSPPYLRLVPASARRGEGSSETITSAKETRPVTVDPGQVIRVNARFPYSPARVLFSFLPPQSDVAHHDPGATEVGSEIQRDGDDLFSFNIDTRNMRGGVGWWYFVSEDDDASKRRAKVGKFTVNDVPRALLERDGAATAVGGSGLDQFGLPATETAEVAVGVGAILCIALAFAG